MKKILFFMMFLLSGCASIFSGTKETFVINSTEKDSKIYFNEEYIGDTAATITVSKKRLPDAIIKVTKEGCNDTVRHIETKFNALTLLGFPVWPINILLIDWGLTGAIREATQTSYIINPICPSI